MLAVYLTSNSRFDVQSFDLVGEGNFAVKYLVCVIIAEGPPVPIPNTEVKLSYAEDTCLATDRENRSTRTLHTAC